MKKVSRLRNAVRRTVVACCARLANVAAIPSAPPVARRNRTMLLMPTAI
jgi:hypothetical protein